MPLTRETENIFYNLRIIIDNKILTEPRAWRVTKVNRVGVKGVSMVTLAQDHFDKNKDYIELDENGNVIGMWADYYKSGITPEENTNKEDNSYAIISYSSVNPEIKVGSNTFKKLDVTFYNGDNLTTPILGVWEITSDYTYNGNTISQIIETEIVNDYQLKIKIPKSSIADMWIGKKMTVKYKYNKQEVSYDIAIKGL